MAANKRRILIEVLGDAAGFKKASGVAAGATGKLQAVTDALGKSLLKAYAIKRVVQFGMAAVKAAAEDAAAQQILATTMRNTTSATDDQIASMEDWITKISHASGFLDDDLRPSMATLLRSTKDQTKAQELMQLAMDISRGTGKDLGTVTSALAKAYGGNTTSLNKLVPGLKVAGESTLDFATAQQRLNQQFSGSAAAYADTAAGRMERLNAQYQDMKESIGTALMPTMAAFVGILATMFGWFNSLDPVVQKVIVALVIGGTAAYVASAAIGALNVAMQAFSTTAKVSQPWLMGISLAIGVVTSAAAIFAGEAESTTESTVGFTDAIKRSTLALLTNADAVAYINGMLPATGAGFQSLSAAVLDLMNAQEADSGTEFIGYLGDVGLTSNDAAMALGRLVGGLNETGDAVAFTSGPWKDYYSNTRSMIDLTTQFTDVQKDEIAYLVETSGSLEQMEARLAAGGIAFDDWTDEMKRAAVGAMKMETAARESDVMLQDIAASYVSAARGASKMTQGLVTEAEARIKARGETVTALATYMEYLAIVQELSPEQQKLALNLDAAATSTTGLAGATAGLTDAQLAHAAAEDSATRAVERSRAKLSDAAQAANDLKAAIDAVFSPFMNFEDAQRGLAEAVDKTTATLKENGATLDLGTEKGRANREVIQGQVDSILDFGVAMVGAGASTEDATAYVNAFTEQLVAQMKAAGLTDDQIAEYLKSLGLTPDNVATTIKLADADKTKRELTDLLGQLEDVDDGAKAEITADIASGNFETARAKIDDLARERNVKLRVSVNGGGSISVIPNHGMFTVSAYAKGTRSAVPGLAVVGEEGPELVSLAGGEQILPAGPTAELLGGGGRRGTTTVRRSDMHFHIAGSVILERQLQEVVASGVRQANRREGRDTLQPRRAL